MGLFFSSDWRTFHRACVRHICVFHSCIGGGVSICVPSDSKCVLVLLCPKHLRAHMITRRVMNQVRSVAFLLSSMSATSMVILFRAVHVSSSTPILFMVEINSCLCGGTCSMHSICGHSLLAYLQTLWFAVGVLKSLLVGDRTVLVSSILSHRLSIPTVLVWWYCIPSGNVTCTELGVGVCISLGMFNPLLCNADAMSVVGICVSTNEVALRNTSWPHIPDESTSGGVSRLFHCLTYVHLTYVHPAGSADDCIRRQLKGGDVLLSCITYPLTGRVWIYNSAVCGKEMCVFISLWSSSTTSSTHH